MAGVKMTYISDPTKLMEARMERQIELVDADGLYPCYYCGRKFLIETMVSVTSDPSGPARCGRKDCKEHRGVK